MKYYIGVDGGGSKTALCAASSSGTSLRFTKTTGSSWREYGIGGVAKNLRNTVDEMMGDDYKKIAGIAMGLPCFGESAEGDRDMEQAIRQAFKDIPVYITNDVEVGWAGSMALKPGINIVAGTGSIAFGKDIHGNTARSGGWSEFFGDEGSCYWVGRKLMEAFSKQSDGRMPKDELYTTVYREFGLKNDISIIDMIHADYSGYRERVASLQFLASKAAEAGAVSAKAIYNEAVQELLLMVLAVKNQLEFPDQCWSVSYSGGLFKAGDLVFPQFSKLVEESGGQIAEPRFSPVEGAILLAFSQFCPTGLNSVKRAFLQ